MVHSLFRDYKCPVWEICRALDPLVPSYPQWGITCINSTETPFQVIRIAWHTEIWVSDDNGMVSFFQKNPKVNKGTLYHIIINMEHCTLYRKPKYFFLIKNITSVHLLWQVLCCSFDTRSCNSVLPWHQSNSIKNINNHNNKYQPPWQHKKGDKTSQPLPFLSTCTVHFKTQSWTEKAQVTTVQFE